MYTTSQRLVKTTTRISSTFQICVTELKIVILGQILMRIKIVSNLNFPCYLVFRSFNRLIAGKEDNDSLQHGLIQFFTRWYITWYNKERFGFGKGGRSYAQNSYATKPILRNTRLKESSGYSYDVSKLPMTYQALICSWIERQNVTWHARQR